MATVVEHDKRKQEILEKALDVFVDEGYEDVTFQKIADRCGITRTTLYIYFKNKREIFLFSIKQLTEGLQEELLEIVKSDKLNYETKLRKLFSLVLKACLENKSLFSVLLPYLLQLQKTGIDPSERVRRRIIKMRHLIALIIIQGIKAGEFKYMNVKDANEMLYGLIESSIFRMAVLKEKDIEEMGNAINLAIDGMLAK